MSDNKFTASYIRQKISTSDIWCTKSLLKIISEDKIQDDDKYLFLSLCQFHVDFDNFSERHIVLIRKILIERYVNIITKLANLPSE